MKTALIVSLAAGLAASGSLYGQAMIGYGVSVGRAGAAGAATGAGAAGIFSGVKGTLDQPDPKSGPAAARQATAEETEKAKKEEKATSESANSDQKDQPAPAAPTWDSGTLTTSNGFVISGLQRRPTRSGYPPTAPGPVVKIDRSTPSAPDDVDAVTKGSQAADGVEPRRTSPSGVFEPIVTSFGTASQGSPQGVSADADSRSPAPLSLEIPAGTPIADLVKRFGNPVLALTGIAGEDYTEKYVFKTPEGVHLTVLGVDGRVTSFVIDNGDDAKRAAL
jgi:hypothetical protein